MGPCRTCRRFPWISRRTREGISSRRSTDQLQNNRFVLGDLIARIGQFQVEASGLSKFQGGESPPTGPDTTPLSVMTPDLAIAGAGVEVRARWADGGDHGPDLVNVVPAPSDDDVGDWSHRGPDRGPLLAGRRRLAHRPP